MRRVLLAFVVFAYSSPAFAQFGETVSCAVDGKRTVTVSGSGTLKVKPDSATFEVAVQTDGQRIQDAWNQNAEKTRAVLSALSAGGAKDDQLQTSLRVQSLREDPRNREAFRVVNGVTVSGVTPEALPNLLQAALSAGANSVAYIRFLVSDSKIFRDKGVDLAFGDARSKAEKLAALAGGTLGPPLCLTEGSGPGGGVTERFAAAALEPPIESGLASLTFSVRVVFELR